MGRAKRVADLFAGIGTVTFALAASAGVDAYEQDEAAIAALGQAALATPKLKPVRTFARDLFRAPLSVGDFARYDAVVLDPPRAGAKAQAETLAASSVPKVAMVSCNPGTCARDLRILADGGYRITRVVPVDQFLFSPHIELVALLEREGGQSEAYPPALGWQRAVAHPTGLASPRESRGPVFFLRFARWIPACAGMTKTD